MKEEEKRMIVRYFYMKGAPRVIQQDLIPYEYGANKGYHKCFAHKWSVMNKYKVLSTYDIDLTISSKENEEFLITFNDPTTEALMSNKIIDVLANATHAIDKKRPILMINLGMVFYAPDKCILEEQNPATSHSNLKFITGKFDISKWVRPINVAFEIQHSPQRIKLNRISILCDLSFHALDINKKIKLEENLNPDPSLLNFSKENSEVTSFVKNTKSLINKGGELMKRYIKF